MASGCTSGHGVCGLSRLSPRSLVAVLTFMAAGMVTVAVVQAFQERRKPMLKLLSPLFSGLIFGIGLCCLE